MTYSLVVGRLVAQLEGMEMGRWYPATRDCPEEYVAGPVEEEMGGRVGEVVEFVAAEVGKFQKEYDQGVEQRQALLDLSSLLGGLVEVVDMLVDDGGSWDRYDRELSAECERSDL